MYPKASWSFTKDVCVQFEKHVRQSVPSYDEFQSIILQLSDFFVIPNGVIYDLGCSTGETIFKINARHQIKKLRFIGIDNAKDMISLAKEQNKSNSNVQFVLENIENYSFAESSPFMLSILTLQFIKIVDRMKIIHKIYDNLLPGGAFILVEKTMPTNALIQDIFRQLHDDFKYESGLSFNEIILKEQSLRGILRPMSVQTIENSLRSVGFSVEVFHKAFNFTGFLAVKPC